MKIDLRKKNVNFAPKANRESDVALAPISNGGD